MKTHYLLVLLITLVSCGESEKESQKEMEETIDPKFTIGGAITGEDAQNVEITLTDANSSITTLNTGSENTFSFPDLSPGMYTVTPTKDGLTFSPVSQSVNLVSNDINNVDFTSTRDHALTIDGLGFDYFNETVFEATDIEDNGLRLNLTQNAIWYHDDEAGLVYSEITGDFVFSSRVSAQKVSNHAQAPDCNVCLGGLMARNPDDTNGENYVHIVVGVNPAGLGVETKNTTNGNSDFTPTDDGSAVYEIQLERQGSTFYLSKRAVGETQWQLAAEYERADMPNSLQVGFNIYTSVSGGLADLSVIFEDVSID